MNIVIATCVRPDLRIPVALAQWVAQRLADRVGSVWGELLWDVCPGNYIDAQRNYLVECHRDADAILFVDADVLPPADVIQRLCALDVPVAVAPCPIMVNGRPAVNVAVESGYLDRAAFDGLTEPFRVRRAGTACMLIRREVFERFSWPWFRTGIRHARPTDPELLDYSDDEWFCDRCTTLGIEIWADAGCVCEHPI